MISTGPAAHNAAAGNSTEPGKRTVKVILVVDDEQLILKSLTLLLSSSDTVVLTCDNLECAEDVLLRHKVDLVITDLRLSGVDTMEGMSLLIAVRDLMPSVPVIIMTASGSEEIREDAYRLGAFHYFEKPFDFRLLAQKTHSLGILTNLHQ